MDKPQPSKGKVGQRAHLDEDHKPPLSKSSLSLSLLIVIVMTVVVTTYWPVLSARALSTDDHLYLTENPFIQSPSWSTAGRFLSEIFAPSTLEGYYQPLAMISLMLDYGMGGRADNLRPFHRTSLALHAMNTALVVVLLYCLFEHAWSAAVVGLLFGLHPLAVEPTAWVADRKTLLAAFFAIACLICYVRYAKKARWTDYAAALVVMVLALMSKPTAVPVPVLMLLLDFWPLRRRGWRIVIEKLPFFCLAGFFAIITVISQGRTAGVDLPGATPSISIPLMVCHNIVFYLSKIVWPVNMSAHYPLPESLSMSQPMVLAGVIGTCVLAVGLPISLRWSRSLLVGGLFFLVAILPTLGVLGFTNVIAADKFAYLPVVGVLLPLAWVVRRVWNDLPRSYPATARRVGVIVLFITVAVSEILTTRHYIAYWHDGETLHQYMVSVAPDAAGPHNNLAFALRQKGKIHEAIEEYRKVVRLSPHVPVGHCNLGIILADQGRYEEAIPHFRMAVQLDPDYVKAHYHLAFALVRTHHVNEAIKHFTEVVRIDPKASDAHNNLANALSMSGQLSEAIRHYEIALKLDPNNAVIHNNLGTKLGQQGRIPEAIGHFQIAARLDPNNADAHKYLGDAFAIQGKFGEAVREYKAALHIQPGHERARAGLNAALAQLEGG